MKFVCERCQTKYSIADDKVRQKVLKIRCKTCENVITIRDAVVVASQVAAMPPPAPAPPAARPARFVEWHIVINGQQDGPFALSTVVTRVLAAKRDEEVYVWNEHLEAWKEPRTVPEVAAEMRARASAMPPPPPPRRPVGPPPYGGAPRPGSSAAHAAIPAHAASAAGAAFGGDEEDRTQIQPLDAAFMLDAGRRSAPASPGAGSHPHPHPHPHPGHGNGQARPPARNGANGASSRSGLEALDFALGAPSSPASVSTAAPALHLPSGAFAAASASVSGVPAIAGSGLSKRVPMPSLWTRHPAIKYVAAGTVLVGLIVAITVMVMNMNDKPNPTVTSAAPKEMAVAELHPVSLEPETRPAVIPVSGAKPAPAIAVVAPAAGGPTKKGPAPRPPLQGKKGPAEPRLTPPPVTATGLAPPPVAGSADPADGEVAKHYTPKERAVPVQRREAASGGGNGEFDQAQFAAVIGQQDHRAAVRSCYERALKRDDRLKVGRLEVRVDVGETGSVKKVSIDAPAEFASVSSCIREVVRRWRFPANARDYEGSFPLLLQGG
jgi:predicted Zn finger-like uncharacterized protein